MSEKRNATTVTDGTHTTKSMPAWWTDMHMSNWDHVKGALERDWEQTKADFSNTSGQKLNQNAGDTLKQSMGSAPIPPLFVKTHPIDPKVAGAEAEKVRDNLAKESAKASATISKAHDDIAEERMKLGEKVGAIREDLAAEVARTSERTVDAQVRAMGQIADAREAARAEIAKEREKIAEADVLREEATPKWRDAEAGVRFGYSVRSQYSGNDDWNDNLEGKLRSEWDQLDTGTSWHTSRAGIQRGWNYAGQR